MCEFIHPPPHTHSHTHTDTNRTRRFSPPGSWKKKNPLRYSIYVYALHTINSPESWLQERWTAAAVRACVCFMYCPNSPGFLELKKKRSSVCVCVCGESSREKKIERKGEKKKELTKSNQFSGASPSRFLVRSSLPPLTPQKSIPLKTTPFHSTNPRGIKVPQCFW